MAAAVTILVVEDDSTLSEILCEELQSLGHVPSPAGTVADGLAQLKQREFEVALLDLVLPDGSGIEVLKQIREEDLPTESIVLTGYAELSTAIEAMKLGAYDYLTKPARMQELEVLVEKAAEKARLRRENVALRRRVQGLGAVQGLVTEDASMGELLATLERVAGSDLPALIQGESGTGKELLARAIHAKSARSGFPFVPINCAAVSENLLESELFGHEKGAFTGALMRKPGLFEVADKGVLFLDEVGDVSPAFQAKLLRAIETKEFFRVGGTRPVRSDIRLVSATNRDLLADVRAGRFREDLYYRINGVTLGLPPLRERKGDIPLLARHFMERSSRTKKLSPKALEALKAYPWPGNVRELQMVIQRAALLSACETIEPEDLSLNARQDWKQGASRSGLTLEQVEREYIDTILKEHKGHRGNAARALGIDPKTLYNKLRRGAEKA